MLVLIELITQSYGMLMQLKQGQHASHEVATIANKTRQGKFDAEAWCEHEIQKQYLPGVGTLACKRQKQYQC